MSLFTDPEQEINVKGVYATIHHFIRSQSDPATPTGTIVVVGSAGSALVLPGVFPHIRLRNLWASALWTLSIEVGVFEEH
jgi:hypothetical protein